MGKKVQKHCETGPGDRGERREFAGQRLPASQATPLGPEHFVKTEELQKALRDVGDIGADRFLEDIDSVVDPTPRYWPHCED